MLLPGTKADIKNRLKCAGFSTVTIAKREVSLDKARLTDLVAFATTKGLI